MDRARIVLFGLGYPAAIAVIARFVPVVRERRWRWLAVHHLGMAAVIAGCVSRWTAVGVVANSAWLVASSVWYAVGGPPPARADQRPAADPPAVADRSA